MKPWVDSMLERLKRLEPGAIVEHAELQQLCDCDGNGTRYRSIVNKALKFLFKETGIKLQSVHGVGYRYPTGDEQHRMALRGMGSGIRQMVKSVRVAAEIADARFSCPQEKAARDFTVQRSAYLVEVCRTERKAIEAHVPKAESRPSMRLAN